jgi:N-acetylneuraminic acid mutarotase
MKLFLPLLLLLLIALAVWMAPPTEGAREPVADAWPALDWKKASPSPFARVESPAAVVGGKFYLFGGFTGNLGASAEINIYDPASDAWAKCKEMPTQPTHLNTAVDGGAIWFAGGFKGKHPGPVTDEVWKYDIAADSWISGPALPEPRGGGGLAVLGRRLHYFGGFKSDRNTDAGDHWSLALDGGGKWVREAEMPDPRGHLAAAVLDGKMYALGGQHGHDIKQVDVDSCHRYDPATKKWSAIAALPDGRSHFESSMIIHKGRILVVGGRCNSSKPPRGVVGDILEYDPKADAWQTVGTMPVKLMAPAAAIISGRLVLTGGGLNNPLPLTEATWVALLPAGR